MLNNKKIKKKLHSIAIENNVTDEIAELIILSPFLFQKEILKDLVVTEDNIDDIKCNFYHKKLGKFYIKKNIVKKINKLKNGVKH